MKKIISVILTAVLLATVGMTFSAYAQKEDSTMFSDSDFLTAYGSLLKNENGKTVLLRGTNLGGWLVYEEWMSAVVGAPAGRDMLDLLEKRFGADGAKQLLDSYQNNYITTEDFDTLLDLGFNCVRLPFWYANLETDTPGEYDFSRLDWAVEQCASRGIYVILDCHGLPGYQSIAHHSGKLNDCHLYDDSPEGERYREESVRLWQAVAEHYKDEPAVAAYDLMNEPMCDFNENQDDAAMWKVYELLYRAVREKDGKHIVIMEAVWNFDHLPDPARRGWKNVAYELHLYDPTDEAYKKIILRSELKGFCVPILVGEFHPSSADAHWDAILALFNKNYINWTTWTYKGYSSWGDTDWFIYGKDRAPDLVDLNTDPFDTILEKWGENLRTSGFRTMGDVQALEKYAREDVHESILAELTAFLQSVIYRIKSLGSRFFC